VGANEFILSLHVRLRTVWQHDPGTREEFGMGRLGIFVCGFLIGGLTVFLSLHYHIVRADDGWHPIRKVNPRFTETYVDIRGFGLSQWQQHPGLIAAIVNAEKRELLGDAVLQPLREAFDSAIDSIDTALPR
jgi:hypothetical protein